MTDNASQAPDADMSFEAALAQLEEIVRKLEAGDQTLDDAIRLYEEGVRLHRLCEEKLAAARGKLERLVESQTGEIAVEPLDDDAEEDI